MGITPDFAMSTSCCYRCIISADKLRRLGLDDYIDNAAIEYWGGIGINKIVMSPCSDGDVVSCYCFYPAEHNNLRDDGWNISATPEQLVATFPGLDERMQRLLINAEDIKMWRCRTSPPPIPPLHQAEESRWLISNSVPPPAVPLLGQG